MNVVHSAFECESTGLKLRDVVVEIEQKIMLRNNIPRAPSEITLILCVCGRCTLVCAEVAGKVCVPVLEMLFVTVKWKTLCCSPSFSFFRHLGLDLVPRKEFEMVDEDQISVSDLYKMVSQVTPAHTLDSWRLQCTQWSHILDTLCDIRQKYPAAHLICRL